MDKHRHRLKWWWRRRLHSVALFVLVSVCACWEERCVACISFTHQVYTHTQNTSYNGRNNKPIQQISRLSIKAIPSISRQCWLPNQKTKSYIYMCVIKCESRASQSSSQLSQYTTILFAAHWSTQVRAHKTKSTEKTHRSFETFRFLMYHNFFSLSFERRRIGVGKRDRERERGKKQPEREHIKWQTPL